MGPWSDEENALIVASYLEMLAMELSHVPYGKSAARRELAPRLQGRTDSAIERKHMNISAVLRDLDFVFIRGYQPYSNYQQALLDEVDSQLNARPALCELARRFVVAHADPVKVNLSLSELITAAPNIEAKPRRVAERVTRAPRAILGRNYLEMEARNHSLGSAGERFALEIEHRRLWEAGQRSLAERVEHVSHTRGDGLGFDIQSFEVDGTDRFIEVKTTRLSRYTPFFASANEVRRSTELHGRYWLYRIFEFDTERRQLFMLAGPIAEHCDLDAVSYRAALRVAD